MMKKGVLCLLLASIAWCGQLPQAEPDNRRVTGIVSSQVGFTPTGTKEALLLLDSVAGGSTAPAPTFTVVDSAGTVKWTGSPQHVGFKWGRELWKLDFSAFADTGVFKVAMAGHESRPLRISPQIWRDQLPAETWFQSFFARQRMTNAEYPANPHLPLFRDSAGTNVSVVGEHSVHGGWQDAHSDDQHLSHEGIVSSLLWAWDVDSSRFSASPGPDAPRILAEAKWGLQFLLSMQNPSGSFANGVTGSPASWQTVKVPRGVQIDTSQALAFRAAGGLAHGAVVFKTRDPLFADSCRNAAKRGWDWAIAHASDTLNLPGYWNAREDSRLSAALFLWRSTGEQKYQDTLEAAILRSGVDNSQAWQPFWASGTGYDWAGYFGSVDMLSNGSLLLTLAGYSSQASPAAQEKISAICMFFRDYWASHVDSYGVIEKTWTSWFGSVGYMVGNAAPVVLAGHMLNDTTLLRLGTDQLQVALGRNPMGKSYVRGVGSDWWGGEWATDTANTWGAVFPGIILADTTNAFYSHAIPTDNCALSGDMGSSGWRCGEWCTGYTASLLLATSVLDAHYGVQADPSSVLSKPLQRSLPMPRGAGFDLLGRSQ